MPDAVLEAKITADFSDFTAQFQNGIGAMQDFEYGADALSRAYQSVSSEALQAESSQEALTQALMGSGEEAQESSSGFFELAAGMAAGVLGAEALSKGFEKLKDFVIETVFGAAELGEKLQNMSESTGVSVEGLERLRFASQLSGKEFETLQRGIGQLAVKMLELQSGASNPTLENAMAKFGLTPEQLSDSEHALDNIAAAFNRVGDSIPKQEKVAIMRELLGRQGADFIPVIAHLDEANAKFDALGIGMGTAAKGAAEAEGSFHELGAELEDLQNKAGAAASGHLKGFADELTTLTHMASTTDWSTLGGLAFNYWVQGTPTLEQIERLKAWHSASAAAVGGGIGGTPSEGGFSLHGATPTDRAQDQISAAPPESKAEQVKGYEKEFESFKEQQEQIVAAAGNTAAARMEAESRTVAFIRSMEASLDASPAAFVEYDKLEKERTSAEMAHAAAAKANAKEIETADNETANKIASNLAKEGAAWDAHYREIEAVARATAEGEQQVDTAKFNLTKAQLAQELEQHKITKAQEVEQLIQAENVEYAAKMKALDDELLMLDVGTAAFARAMAQRQALEIQHQTQITQTQTQGDKGGPLANLGTSVTGQFENAFTQLTTKATTAKQFLAETFKEIASDFIHLAVQMVAESTAFTAIETGLKSIFTSVAPAAAAALAASGVTTQAMVTQKAGEAAASQFAAVMAIVPYPENLGIAPGEAAKAFFETEAFGVAGSAAQGAYLQQDMPVFAHAKEMVLPANISDHIMSSMGEGGGGDTHIHHSHTWNVNTLSGSDLTEYLKGNYGAVMETIEHGLRQAHPTAARITGARH